MIGPLLGGCLLAAIGWSGWVTRPAPSVGRRLGLAAPDRWRLHRPARPGRRPWMAATVGAVALAALVAPSLAVAVPAVVVLVDRRRRRGRDERALDELRRDLSEVVDLLALAAGGGLTVPLAVEAVASTAPGRVGDELRRVAQEVRAGRRCADALDDLPRRLGEPVRPVATALVASDRYGTPLGASLERLSSELRADRRRRAEELARRLPVRLLFPLVCCVLPAFGLLTVAPLLAGAFGSLRL